MSSIYDSMTSAKGTGSIYDTPIKAAVPTAPQPKTSIYDRLANPTGLGLIAAPVVSAFKGATEGLQNTPVAPKTGDFLGETVKAISNAIKQGSTNLDQHLDTVQKNGLFSLKGGTAGAQTVLDDINTVFGVALSPLQGIASVPGVGGVVDGLNKVFGAIGEGGGQAATQILHELPIPQDAKDTLAPLVHDTASFVAQILAGKTGGDAFHVLGDKVKAITNTVDSQIKGAQALASVKNVPVTGETLNQEVPITKVRQLRLSQPEPLQQLPPGKSTALAELPHPEGATAVTAPEDLTKPNFTVDLPTRQSKSLPSTPTEAAPTVEAPKAIINAEPAPTETLSAPAKGQVTKVASDINATLVKQGFDALPPEEQSKFTPKSYSDSLQKTVQLMDETLPQVKDMATTGKGIPRDVHPQILFNAVEALATKEGDGALLADLAKSPLGKKLSEAGSTMGSHGYNDNPNSAVEGMRRVNEARQALMKDAPEQKVKVTEQMTKETRAARSPKTSWEEFAKQIVCNI